MCGCIFDEALFGLGGFAWRAFYVDAAGWSIQVDKLRDEIWKNHPQIILEDFDFYNTEIFNHCENSNHVLMAIPGWPTCILC